MSRLRITDLSPLRGMPLATLGLSQNQVVDLSPLSECKGLNSLTCRGTKATAGGVAALQKALPNCKIEWDDRAKPTPSAPTSSGAK